MSRQARRREGTGGLEILEEAVHLLRRVPGSAFASYYVGSVSFVLGFLYFWADMSRGAFAGRHAVEAAFFLSMLFVWMKCWQTVFTRQVNAALTGASAPSWRPGTVVRLVLAQTAIQPSGLLLLPAALLVTLPFGWVYAYYQNITIFGDGENQDLKSVTQKARHQAMLFQKQNHVALAVLALFGVFVFLNIGILLYLGPQLLRVLSGIETVFTLADWRVLNTTFLSAVAGMTYLVVDPLVKSVYVLRCFYGESILTGEDLKADLNNIRFRSNTGTIATVLFFLAVLPGAAASAGEAVFADKLDNSISEVISRPEYAWRMPRVNQASDDGTPKGPFAKFLTEALDTVTGWVNNLKTWIQKAAEWILEKLFGRINMSHGPRAREGLPQSVFILLYTLLAITASVFAVIFLRTWRRRKVPAAAIGEHVLKMPDLSSEEVAADELTANSWLDLGRDLMERGELRLALRAFYLACLSSLAERGYITIALFKSNQEYERELKRKAHAKPGLLSAFTANVCLFERIWYGTHAVTAEVVRGFIENQKRILANGEDAV
jgi:hypothetical protein